ncbi:response regulator transcription factor [Brachybacterium sp. FME24]|uniref:response regulator n=1 Tax=Brachybacterium sp. FME24 TaxID=2742605 RepID=UPI0018668F62|nr:response regulator transcription factor [Brachybacterium sp. FME24]
MIRLVIVDDHPIVRGGLRDTFAAVEDIVVVGEAGDGAEGIDRVMARTADVVLMDLRMPGMDGVSATAALRELVPDVRVLILTTFDSERDVLPAIEAGAIGYLLKDALPDELMRAVRAAARGESVLAPSVTQHLMGQVRGPSAGSLTGREKEVLQLVANGSSNREAATALFIGEASIKTHLQHIYDKLGVRDRASAVAEGYRRRLLT